MGIYIEGLEMPKERENFTLTIKYNGLVFDSETGIQIAEAQEVPSHGRLIDADALAKDYDGFPVRIDPWVWNELSHAPTIIPASNDAAVILTPQIVHCCECEFNNHCLTQAFVEDESKIPFDKNTWFCADAQAASTTIPAEEDE